MSDLTAFLLARLDEDEHRAKQAWAGGHRGSRWLSEPGRQLAECEAKRAVIEEARNYSPELSDGDNGEWAFGAVLRQLATVYDDHPDYREEWKP